MVQLGVRKPAQIIPDYSLTSDVLSFSRCGLQYRFNNVGGLPATRPVQLWFGQFLHGVLEEGFRRYSVNGVVPHTQAEVDDMADLVTRRLAASGIRARNAALEATARWRAQVLLTDLAPSLFPLIAQAEVRLTSTRTTAGVANPSRYQMAGVVDVITNVQLAPPTANSTNLLVAAIQSHLPQGVVGSFEVIVDYKGSRRGPVAQVGSTPGHKNLSQVYEWQVLTYAQLRGRQAGALPVVAGVLIYLNELAPTWQDVRTMRAEIAAGTTPVAPVPGSPDEVEMNSSSRAGNPNFSLDFRLKRALNVVPVSPHAMSTATSNFDLIAGQIQDAVDQERGSGSVLRSWTNLSTDPDTCVACDFKQVCPKPAKASTAPAVTKKRRRP